MQRPRGDAGRVSARALLVEDLNLMSYKSQLNIGPSDPLLLEGLLEAYGDFVAHRRARSAQSWLALRAQPRHSPPLPHHSTLGAPKSRAAKRRATTCSPSGLRASAGRVRSSELRTAGTLQPDEKRFGRKTRKSAQAGARTTNCADANGRTNNPRWAILSTDAEGKPGAQRGIDLGTQHVIKGRPTAVASRKMFVTERECSPR